ncbi:hypothetical protein [Marinagarivorans cellulosilyticus]|uniref:Uncharacterized protein n=1 Tax=Marinagarivorans cellulosilyticus TaxID=2721545 RepID=A0AAN1WLP4_9GAMM|nr:hypothetical protein [Marinagarivorans cellulosilyticus]BCD99848.1 hypothetical protein MARGE09_P4050 [Marinagarivorans cellulosilyticus]
MGIFRKLFKADSRLSDIGKKIEESYRKESHKNLAVSKNSIIIVIDSFFDLSQERDNKESDSYYLGNLISTGRIEGTKEEVFGTLKDAVERTKDLIMKSDEIYASQCSFYSRNLKVILEKENFEKDPRQVLGDRVKRLEEIASGKIT